MRVPLKVILSEIDEARPNRCEPAPLGRTCPSVLRWEHAFSLSFFGMNEKKVLRLCGSVEQVA